VRSSLLVGKRSVQKQESGNGLKEDRVHSWDQAMRRHERTSPDQGSRSKKPFQIRAHYHRALRASSP
jgi:hypothetical protein